MKRANGYTTIFAMTIAVAILITFSIVYDVMRRDDRANQSFLKYDQDLKIAESGTNKVIGRLMTSTDLVAWDREYDPVFANKGDKDANDNYRVSKAESDGSDGEIASFSDGTYLGHFRSFAKLQKDWQPEAPSPIYHIITTGWSNKIQNPNRMTLHTYVQFSNAGDYFAAIRGDAIFGQGADIRNGRVMAGSLVFNPAPAGTDCGDGKPNENLRIRVKSAEYVNSLTPDTGNWPEKDCLQINGSSIEVPEHLPTEPLFPMMDDNDLAYYKGLAKLAVFTTDLNLDGTVTPIKPPCYQDTSLCTSVSQRPDRHFFYTSGNVNIKGKYKGQIVIVSEKSINITGDLMKYSKNVRIEPDPDDSGSEYDVNASEFSDVGGATSNQFKSNAHQMVLIAKEGIFIDKAVVDSPGVDGDQDLFTFEAFVIAPTNTINVDNDLHATRDDKSIKMTCAMILNDQPSIRTGFNKPGGLSYSYDESLRTQPPPIPRVVRVFAQIERRGDYTPGSTFSVSLPNPSPCYGCKGATSQKSGGYGGGGTSGANLN